MAGSWRIITHPEREWIIESGSARCAVRGDLGRALLALEGQAPDAGAIHHQLVKVGWATGGADAAAEDLSEGLARILAGPGSNRAGPGGKAVWLRVPLVPARIVGWAAGCLQGLASTRSLASFAIFGGGFYLVAGWGGDLTGPANPGDIALGLGLFFLLGLIHEFGHAAALRREGYPPGRIGLGLLFIIPVLFADVSAVAVLPRSGKLRVDLAGVCFQLVMGGAFFAAGTLNSHLEVGGALRLAGLLALGAVAWSLLPFIRADGYWFLADMLDLTDLDQPAPRDSGQLLRVFLVLHRAANVGFLVLVGLAVPLRLWSYLSRAAGALDLPLAWAQVVAGVFALAGWWGIGRRLTLLWRACRCDLAGLRRTHPREIPH